MGLKTTKTQINTIIHEIAHLGMEETIVRKFRLPHGLKERIVDKFVFLMFQDLLPNYKVQNMGDQQVDRYVASQEDLTKLNSNLQRYLQEVKH